MGSFTKCPSKVSPREFSFIAKQCPLIFHWTHWRKERVRVTSECGWNNNNKDNDKCETKDRRVVPFFRLLLHIIHS